MNTKEIHQIRSVLEDHFATVTNKKARRRAQKALTNIYMEIKATSTVEDKFFNLDKQTNEPRTKG